MNETGKDVGSVTCLIRKHQVLEVEVQIYKVNTYIFCVNISFTQR